MIKHTLVCARCGDTEYSTRAQKYRWQSDGNGDMICSACMRRAEFFAMEELPEHSAYELFLFDFRPDLAVKFF